MRGCWGRLGFNAEIEVSRVDGLPIDGDGESVFDLIDLSIVLCELLREGDGEGGTSVIDSSGAADGWRVGIDGGVIGDLLREGVSGVAGQIGDASGVVRCGVGVGEQEALSFLEGVGVAEADQECAVGGISGIELCEVVAEGCSALLSIDKEFEISISEVDAINFLVEFELESFAISEELNALHASCELRAAVVGSAAADCC